MKSYIFIENIKIFAYHGVLEQEKKVGNYFLINIKLTLDLTKAVASDLLLDTISYADVYELVKLEMKIPSQLIEHIAGRIMFKIKNTYQNIEEIEIKLSKLNPPLGGQVEAASVLLIG